jgi:hypothetical protein
LPVNFMTASYPDTETPKAAPTLIEVDNAVILKLRPAAAQRGMTVAAIAREILDVVATEKLVDAVLDDG